MRIFFGSGNPSPCPLSVTFGNSFPSKGNLICFAASGLTFLSQPFFSGDAMNFIEMEQRKQRKNQILFAKTDPCLFPLWQRLEQVNRRTVVAWALACLEEPVEQLSRQYPANPRPREALETTRLWAMGRVKMPQARPAILAVHAMAKQLSDLGDAAFCHGVGQGCSTVHTLRHAMGLPIYELTALAHHTPPDQLAARLERKIQAYHETLDRCLALGDAALPCWASFLQD